MEKKVLENNEQICLMRDLLFYAHCLIDKRKTTAEEKLKEHRAAWIEKE